MLALPPPSHRGLAPKLDRSLQEAFYHGKNGLGGEILPLSPGSLRPEEAVEHALRGQALLVPEGARSHGLGLVVQPDAGHHLRGRLQKVAHEIIVDHDEAALHRRLQALGKPVLPGPGPRLLPGLKVQVLQVDLAPIPQDPGARGEKGLLGVLDLEGLRGTKPHHLRFPAEAHQEVGACHQGEDPVNAAHGE